MALTKVTGQVINDTTGLVVGVTTVGGGLSATDGFFSGIVTAVGDASFSGNVSVGGTLTYEDVTNIDAVGLVTARNGIVVGSGITLSKDGDGFFTGVVTATSYAGDGSGLTGIAATDNVRTGILDVAGVGTFRNDVNIPDKIIHLGDTNTAIRFPAADTITAETGGSERLRITSDGRLLAGTATSKSAGSGQYGKFNIEGGTGTTENFVSFSRAEAASAMSANDEVANLTFNDSAGYEFARIQVAADAATGATDTPGRIVLSTTADGSSSSTERLRITKDGAIGIAGANYGTSGQVLASQGSSSAIQWATPGLIYEGSATTFPTNTGVVDADVILDACRRIEIYYLGVSINSNSGEFIIQLRTGSGTITSGYKGSGHYLSNTSYATSSQNTSSFQSKGLGDSSASYSGHIVLKNYNAHYWYCNADFWNDNAATGYWISGHVNAGAALAGVRLSNAAGSYDSGEYKIMQYNTP